jgi:adenosine deaminase/adenosine deaminase CECR1
VPCAQAAPVQRRAESPEQRTARHFETIRSRPPQLFAFLRRMPKGGDLHNHLSGAIYAENFIRWAAEQGLCVNQTTMSFVTCDQTPSQEPNPVPASTALTNGVLYRQLVDAMSMRNWQLSGQSGHDHFFDAFAKFGAVSGTQTGPMIAEAAARAARGHVSYLELMFTTDGGTASRIGNQVGWDGNAEVTLTRLKAAGISDSLVQSKNNLLNAERDKNELLLCGTPQADPGCDVTIRYIYSVSRGAALGPVYAQMVAGFMLATEPGSKVVGLNLVQAEDTFSSMENFKTQMGMLDFLHRQYPTAHISLHAGELAAGLVPPEGLSFHIRESVMLGHAERIGHGIDIMHEDEPEELLREMARRNIMVEICLTSNDVILGVSGKNHPLATYLQFGVPAALATDDEGVARSEMTVEFMRAVEDQQLNYVQLKTMARTSLQYAFIPGSSLWLDAKRFTRVAQCAGDNPSRGNVSANCRQFLSSNDKARLQWALEEEFSSFESRY